MTKTVKEPLFHLVKRTDSSAKRAWLIRVAAFAISILLCAIVTVAASGKGIGFFFKYFFQGVFGSELQIWSALRETAILLLIALAITPCFKMKFWNIGAEGQVLMGALGCAVIVYFLGGKINDAGTIILSFMLSLVFGMAWAVIPALFKAKWNTNETLLTLMMNYIATCIVSFFIKKVKPNGTGDLPLSDGVVPPIAGNEYILTILIVVVLTILIAIYLKYSKHGYELTVVGESPNTARYIGINSKKVIIRTLILCGVMCGIAGFILVSVQNHAVKETAVNGRGFTAVLISWLAHFNPLAMTLTSFLVVFITNGSSEVGTYGRLGTSYPSVMTGIFFLCIIATEFFINYKVVFKHSHESKKSKTNTVGALGEENEQEIVISETVENQESSMHIDVVQDIVHDSNGAEIEQIEIETVQSESKEEK